MKILVTGGSGFLGSFLLRKLVSQGHSIRAIKRQNSRIPTDLQGPIEWVEADILDVTSLMEATTGITHLYHCAAFVTFYPKNFPKLHQINIDGTSNVVNVAIEQGIQKMLFVSSVAALGRKSGVSTDESFEWQKEPNISNYSESKHLSEMEVWRGQAEGLSTVIVNPSIIIGPADHWDRSSAAMFQRAWDGLPFYPTGSSGFVDVRDCVDAMVQLMESDIENEQFVLNAANYSYQDFFKATAKYMNKTAPKRPLPNWAGSIAWRLFQLQSMITGKEPLVTKETVHNSRNSFGYDSSKVQEKLGMKFRPIEESIKDSCEAFIANQKDNRN